MDERRTRRSRTARRRITGVLATLTSIAFVATLATPPALAAPAKNWPSWADVQAAKASEAAARAQLDALNRDITAAQAEVDRTQKEAELRGTEYAEAQQAYDEQSIVTQNIQGQLATAQSEAASARLESTQLISGLAKQGASGDLTAGIASEASTVDSYLYRIGALQKVSERSDSVYEKAVQLQNTAQSLSDQAAVAQAKLEELRLDAEAKLAIAQEAAQLAATRYAELQEAKAKSETLVAFLTGQRQQTEVEYKKGLEEMWGSGAAGEVSPSGWAKPAAGYISSVYGMRVNPVSGVLQLHTGVDLAGGCGIPIYAAHAGRVEYAGWFGSWGNYVRIDHGNGVSTAYAHIMPGGIGVSIGQQVGPGQLIARVGTTGQSTGCHLHYIVRVNGETLTDPVPFMRNQGIKLG